MSATFFSYTIILKLYSLCRGEYNAIVATFSGCCLAVVDVTENISEQKLFRFSYPLCFCSRVF